MWSGVPLRPRHWRLKAEVVLVSTLGPAQLEMIIDGVRSGHSNYATALLPGGILPREPVYRFPDEVGVADVARVLLDQVDQDAPQAG